MLMRWLDGRTRVSERPEALQPFFRCGVRSVASIVELRDKKLGGIGQLYGGSGRSSIVVKRSTDIDLVSGRSSAWLERLVRDQEVAGSNPVAPTC